MNSETKSVVKWMNTICVKKHIADFIAECLSQGEYATDVKSDVMIYVKIKLILEVKKMLLGDFFENGLSCHIGTMTKDHFDDVDWKRAIEEVLNKIFKRKPTIKHKELSLPNIQDHHDDRWNDRFENR